MTDPTNPGERPDPGAPPPPPTGPPATFPPPTGRPSFPPPTGRPSFPPPTQAMPIPGDPVGPPTGPPAGRSKGPLFAGLAIAAVLLGALAYLFLGNEDDDTRDVATSALGSDTTDGADGPGGKEGTADEVDKGEEQQPDDTATGDAQGYGDDPALDALYDQCEAGDFQACDDLYSESGFDTEYEDFGDTCGNRNEPSGYCVDLYADDGVRTSGGRSYGDNPQLDASYDQCEAGNFQACDTLYAESDFGSEYEEFGDTCGNRNEPSGYCVDLYANDGG